MDRDTVRLVLILIGITLMAVIYIWGRFKHPLMSALKSLAPEGSPPEGRDDKELTEESLMFEETVRVLGPAGASRREPLFSGLDRDVEDHEDEDEIHPETPSPHQESTQEDVKGAPFLIQVSVVSGPGRHFHGPELKQALLDNDLLYGDMGIFHRYSPDLSQTRFSVASLVEPGTFPIDDMEGFECPGIILFFQTARVPDPLATYDDLVNTSRELAQQLHGLQWDETRQALSASKISQMRNLLKQQAKEGR